MIKIRINQPYKKINIAITAPFFLIFSLFTTVEATLTLDEFSTTQVVLYGEQSCVTGPDIIGGERGIWAYLTGGVQINSVVTDQLHLHNQSPLNWTVTGIVYDGIDQSASSGYLGGLGHIDLTQSGQNIGFALDCTAINNKGGRVGVEVYQAQVPPLGSKCMVDLPTTAGIIVIPFDQFIVYGEDPWGPVDFSDVGMIKLIFELSPDESCTVDSFYVIPEPCTFMLVAFGGLILRRKPLKNNDSANFTSYVLYS